MGYNYELYHIIVRIFNNLFRLLTPIKWEDGLVYEGLAK